MGTAAEAVEPASDRGAGSERRSPGSPASAASKCPRTTGPSSTSGSDRFPPTTRSSSLSPCSSARERSCSSRRGERRIRLPYFFLGAAFFLLETSNVVRMSLLYGSTWWVNTVVFAGILALVLLSNLTAHFWKVPLGVCLAALSVGIVLAAAVPSDLLLALPAGPRAVVAVALFLGPVYFGGLVFARLISRETRLFEAYGSNVLGAVLGGAAEYLSLLIGFRFLLALALAFYVAVFLLLHKDGEPT